VKILIDAFPLLAPKSGVGYYTWHLLTALKNLYASQDDFIYFYGRRFSRDIADRPPALDAVTRTTLKKLFKDPYRFTQPIKELVFRIGSHILKPDIYHETNYVLLPYSRPSVVTVFDMSILRHPETHPAGRVRFFNDYFQKRLPAAHHILSISEFTRQELISLMNIDPAKITVTPLAPPPNFSCPGQEELSQFIHEKQLPEKYLLYLGNLEPRKNLVMLIKAYELFVSRTNGTIPPLVLAGEPTWLSEQIFDEVRSRKLESHVIFPGYVPEHELPFWYAGATTFLYPSLYEGFGLPLVEAMAVGTPVLAAHAGSLPEVAGDAALLLPPHDPDAWADALCLILENDEQAMALRAKGLERAAGFSWEHCARITHRVYEKVLTS